MTSDGSDTPVLNDVQITHDGTSGSRVTRWTYDDAGNITQQARVTDAGTETDTRAYNNLNQLTTSSGGRVYSYDLDGNLTEKNNGDTEGCERWEFQWSEQSRLVQVKKGVYDATPLLVNEFTVDYQYDEMGRMLRRDDGTDVTDYFYDGWDIWKEVTGESVTEYLVPGMGIRSFLRDGELFTLHADGLGTVRTVTDSEGEVAARFELDAWGETLSGSVDLVPGGSPLGFVGGLGVRRDRLTGLVWMRYRHYDPTMSRFVSRDPIGLSGGTNLYSYCANQPTSSVDPSGLKLRGWPSIFSSFDILLDIVDKQREYAEDSRRIYESQDKVTRRKGGLCDESVLTFWNPIGPALNIWSPFKAVPRGPGLAKIGVVPPVARTSEAQFEAIARNATKLTGEQFEQFKAMHPNLKFDPSGEAVMDYFLTGPLKSVVVHPPGEVLAWAVSEEAEHFARRAAGIAHDESTSFGVMMEELSTKLRLATGRAEIVLEGKCPYAWGEADIALAAESLSDYVASFLNGTLKPRKSKFSF